MKILREEFRKKGFNRFYECEVYLEIRSENRHIIFDKNNKFICLGNNEGEECEFSLDEIALIIKQGKELGWNESNIY